VSKSFTSSNTEENAKKACEFLNSQKIPNGIGSQVSMLSISTHETKLQGGINKVVVIYKEESSAQAINLQAHRFDKTHFWDELDKEAVQFLPKPKEINKNAKDAVEDNKQIVSLVCSP
jgi:hypothetical protein